MEPNPFSVHFIVRQNRIDRRGLAWIYAKISINKGVLNHTSVFLQATLQLWR